MNNQATLDQLHSLRLSGMASVFTSALSLPMQERPSIEYFMAKLTEAELQERSNKKTTMYLKTSKLRYNATLENIKCSTERNLSKETVFSLSDCSFVKRAENLLITGKTGCGKSFLACALGRQACHFGIRTIYLAMNKFIEKIELSKIDGSFIKVINQIEKNDLVIFDDFGLQPLTTNTRLALLQILEDCFERKSVIITSQLPVSKWFEYINEPTIADAIMDRITSNAHRIELDGDTMRNKNINY
jgi:DNA replication protein DnaC